MLLANILRFNKFSIFQRGTQNMAFSSAAVSKTNDKFALPSRYKKREKSVWVEYIQLALEHKPLNLGQGFADFPAPEHVINALAQTASAENALMHQYTRGFGHIRLVTALSKLYAKLLDREINHLTDVLITAGANEALYSALLGHVDKGDEVIIIEPFFDAYESLVKTAGGVARFIPLRLRESPCSTTISSGDYVLDTKELECMFNEKSKVLVLNTPNNILGKVFTEAELIFIADLCKKWNVLCISDEVYEWLVYKPFKHTRIAALPDMWERTITIGSVGKTFSVTGWKTGWAVGPANLMINMQLVHQICVYTCPTPIQEAIAIIVETETCRMDSKECYFYALAEELEAKRDFMSKLFNEVCMIPIVPEGGYFMTVDWTPLEAEVDLKSEKDKYKDYRFTKWMIKNVGLLGMPTSSFYSEPNKKIAENYIRFCFIKKDESLQKAAEILKKWKGD